MGREKPQVVVLCEDKRHWAVLHHFLKQHGIGERKIRVVKSPGGRGAADSFIRKQFPAEVRAYRSKCSHLNICLLVMIDADPGNSPGDRINMLHESLRKKGIDPVKPEDRIALVVPRRNIESWMHFVIDNVIDEKTDYKHDHSDSDSRLCGERLKQIQMQFRAGSTADALPPSLGEAIREIERICHCR